mgnify:CR=1 FL=1
METNYVHMPMCLISQYIHHSLVFLEVLAFLEIVKIEIFVKYMQQFELHALLVKGRRGGERLGTHVGREISHLCQQFSRANAAALCARGPRWRFDVVGVVSGVVMDGFVTVI